jgi:ABC-2 type transport system permease protein
LVGVILMTWFFLTPIIYPIEKIPVEYLSVYFLNPMASLITLYRHCFLGTPIPCVNSLYLSLGITGLVFVVGLAVFSCYQKYFADEL